ALDRQPGAFLLRAARGGGAALLQRRTRRAPPQGRHRSRRQHSGRTGGRRGCRIRSPLVPPHRRGRDARDAGDDRQISGQQMIDVLSVASEAYPLIKTGGLADVAGALPGALSPHGVLMRTLIPGYPAVMREAEGARVVHEFDDLFDGRARLLAGRAAGLDLIILDAPHLYDRPGNPYLDPTGRDWPDNWKRFAALSWVAGKLALGLIEGYQPQIVHAHDWTAGLALAYVKYGPSDQVKT